MDPTSYPLRTWDSSYPRILSYPILSYPADADLWMKGDASTNLMSVLREGFHIDKVRVHHRIFVCDPAKATHRVSANGNVSVVNIQDGSEKDAASAWKPTVSSRGCGVRVCMSERDESWDDGVRGVVKDVYIGL